MIGCWDKENVEQDESFDFVESDDMPSLFPPSPMYHCAFESPLSFDFLMDEFFSLLRPSLLLCFRNLVNVFVNELAPDMMEFDPELVRTHTDIDRAAFEFVFAGVTGGLVTDTTEDIFCELK